MMPASLALRAGRPALLALALAAAFAAGARPQAVPSDNVLREFKSMEDFVLWVDGRPVPTAEMYQSESAHAVLILTGALPAPALVRQGEDSVATVNIMKVLKKKDGTVDLLADAELAPQGPFTFGADGVVRFKLDRHAVELRPRPPLLGLHSGADLKAYSPDYTRRSQRYQTNPQAIAALQATPRPVTVRIFFGSWCPHCRENVPHVLRVEDAVKGSKIHFEYFGLPEKHLADGPEPRQFKVQGVPTGVVLAGGREIGRLYGNDDWRAPEVSLAGILRQAQGAGKR
jgi:thiol-disulfide isomerase/thioredoxin